MNLQTLYQTPSAAITLTCEEVQIIRDCSAMHYDNLCKSSGMFGGFLYGWKNKVEWAKESGGGDPWIEATFKQCGIVLKILEVGHYGSMQTVASVGMLYRLTRFFMDICTTLNNSSCSHEEINP